MGFLGAIIMAFIYNIVSRIVGGIEVDVIVELSGRPDRYGRRFAARSIGTIRIGGCRATARRSSSRRSPVRLRCDERTADRSPTAAVQAGRRRAVACRAG